MAGDEEMVGLLRRAFSRLRLRFGIGHARVLNALGKGRPKSAAEVAAETGMRPHRARRCLGELFEEGIVGRDFDSGKGKEVYFVGSIGEVFGMLKERHVIGMADDMRRLAEMEEKLKAQTKLGAKSRE